MLEKILVDMYVENKLFYLYQGAELSHIYENAIKNRAINYTRLFSYTKRREKEQDIKVFMMKHIPHLVKDIIDDFCSFDFKVVPQSGQVGKSHHWAKLLTVAKL